MKRLPLTPLLPTDPPPIEYGAFRSHEAASVTPEPGTWLQLPLYIQIALSAALPPFVVTYTEPSNPAVTAAAPPPSAVQFVPLYVKTPPPELMTSIWLPAGLPDDATGATAAICWASPEMFVHVLLE